MLINVMYTQRAPLSRALSLFKMIRFKIKQIYSACVVEGIYGRHCIFQLACTVLVDAAKFFGLDFWNFLIFIIEQRYVKVQEHSVMNKAEMAQHHFYFSNTDG